MAAGIARATAQTGESRPGAYKYSASVGRRCTAPTCDPVRPPAVGSAPCTWSETTKAKVPCFREKKRLKRTFRKSCIALFFKVKAPAGPR
jgi:hypothetical protein